MAVLVFKLVRALISAAACLWWAQSGVYRVSDSRFDRSMFLLWAVTRLGLYIATFFILEMSVTPDVTGLYLPEGLSALSGGAVYRDFESPYGPVFPYLIACVLRIWPSAKAIVLATILIDGASFFVWSRIVRTLWPGEAGKTAVAFYVLSSFALIESAVTGQNQAWIALLLGLATLLFMQNRKAASAIVTGISIVAVKFLPILYLPVFLR